MIVLPDGREVLPVLRLEVGLEGQYVLGDVGRGALSVRFIWLPRIDLVIDYGIFLEPRETGALDTLGLGRIGAAFRIFDEPDLDGRVGLALRYLHDPYGWLAGAEAFAAFDLFPIEPLVLRAEVGISVLDQAAIARARGTVGLVFQQVEVFVGWDHSTIAPYEEGVPAVDLTGPLLGLRAWL